MIFAKVQMNVFIETQMPPSYYFERFGVEFGKPPKPRSAISGCHPKGNDTPSNWRKIMLRTLTTVALLFAWSTVGTGEEQKMTNVKGKKALIIIASQNFRDEEFIEPYELLKNGGATVTIASSKKTPARGALGKVVTPDLPITEATATNYDAVVFVGGPGAEEYFNNTAAHKLAQEAVKADKALAAICIAPAILANAGVLKDKKATCFSSEESTLRKGGAVVVKQNVVRDGKIITANGPKAAKEFAQTLAATLERSPP
jgi:protease I